MNRWNNALAFAQEFLDVSPEPAGSSPIATPVDRESRPGEEEPILSEEAFAIRESAPEPAAESGAVIADEPTPPVAAAPQIAPTPPSPAPPAGSLNIRVLPQPLSTRSRSAQPSVVVLHATAGASAMSSINHLRSVGLSYHYIIARDGRDSARTNQADSSAPIVFHCVADRHRGAHVGSTIPAPSGQGSFNECSIGISLANRQDGQDRYTAGQIAALDALLAHLKQTHSSLRWLTNHAFIQPWNRSDPLSINADDLAARHGYTVFRPTAAQIRAHRR